MIIVYNSVHWGKKMKKPQNPSNQLMHTKTQFKILFDFGFRKLDRLLKPIVLEVIV
jgi:hypothetical protein